MRGPCGRTSRGERRLATNGTNLRHRELGFNRSIPADELRERLNWVWTVCPWNYLDTWLECKTLYFCKEIARLDSPTTCSTDHAATRVRAPHPLQMANSAQYVLKIITMAPFATKRSANADIAQPQLQHAVTTHWQTRIPMVGNP